MTDAVAAAEANSYRVLRVARPDGDRRLRDGWVIEVSVLARLLRVRLLRLEARVALVPAALAETAEYERAPHSPETSRGTWQANPEDQRFGNPLP